ncbi:MAG TPA: hypothetical protein VMB80_07005 [Candidatus Acidoferrum sp.]|nr:hypothetical protein [Candidatus Acidoferrum sp.]
MKRSTFYAISCLKITAALALLAAATANLSAQLAPCIETNGIKFVALPNLSAATGGMDVKDSRQNIVLADDFPCTNSGPITDIHLWGSWAGNLHGPITNFWIGIYSDVPQSINGTTIVPSHPGQLLWYQDFGTNFSESPGPTGNEYFYNPTNNTLVGTDTQAWYYCFFPTNPFVQQGSINQPTNYWLAVRAQLADQTTLFGWKNTTNLYNDAAVWGTVVGGFPNGIWQSITNPITQQRLNLSMMLTTPTNQPPPPQNCCPDTNTVKWVQGPDLANGVDYNASLPFTLADDFQCTNTGPITDIHLWGSWVQDQVDVGAAYTLAIWTDVPTNVDITYSHPGNLLWYYTFYPGSYIVCTNAKVPEPFNNPDGAALDHSTNLFYLCFFIDPHGAFTQMGTQSSPSNYWLSVTVQPSAGGAPFGWKSSTNVYNDKAVFSTMPFPPSFNGWNPIIPSNPNNTRVDLAFKITTLTNNNPPPPPCCPETNAVKWVQWPDLVAGIDYNTTLPFTVADDFQCTNTGPITDIHLWGSWLLNSVDYGATYRLAIWSDVPTIPGNPYSHPGDLLWSQDFLPGYYTICPYTNKFEPFNGPDGSSEGSSTNLYYICFNVDPANAFLQTGTQNNHTNYWLSVTVFQSATGVNQFFGWKSSTNVYNDNAVFSTVPFPPPPTAWTTIPTSPVQNHVDLAFKITTQTNNCIVPITCSVDKTNICGSPWTFDLPVVGPDPCCAAPPIITGITNVTTFSPCLQVYTAIWTILDACSGSVLGVCTQHVTIVDTNPPTMFNCITQKTVECGSTWTFDQPIAQYLCTGSNAVVGILSSNIYANVLCSGIVGTIVWSTTNQCSGAVSTCTQNVSVVDSTPPAITCTTNKNVRPDTPWTFDPPTAYDLCCGTNVTINILNTTTNGTNCAQTFTRVWQAVDCCGNKSTTCTQVVTMDCSIQCVESDYEKYVQWPKIIGGFDVWNNPYVLADDFVCTNTGPISDIHLWGSWLNDQPQTNSITFWLGIYDDVPATTNLSSGLVTPSHPGTNLMWQQWFAPGQYAETIWTNNASEQFLDPGSSNSIGGDFVVWYYCFYPTNAFQQTGTPTNSKTYWLAAYAQLSVVGGNFNYGWKTATNQQHDVSVHAIWPGAPPTNNPGWTPTMYQSPLGGPPQPLDLAFKLTMCGPVKIQYVTPNQVKLTWPGGGFLQSATNVLGPYLDVPGFPTSPYFDSTSIPPTNRFYRIRCY